MKRCVIIIGLLLCVVLPRSVSAQANGADFSCTSVDGLEAVSAYAQMVLARADSGLVYAREAGATTDFLSILPGWALSIASTWAGLTDTAIQRTDSVTELDNVSACLHLDMTLIDCKIEDVRQELRAQTSRGSFVAIIRLTSLLQFLNERKTHLTAGALDPQYADPTWGRTLAFDRDGTVWCASPQSGNVCVQKSDADCRNERGSAYRTLEACTDAGSLPPDNPPIDDGRLCPFDSDYAPAFDSGFGCDIGVMEPRQSYPPVKAELDGLKAISGSLAAYRRTATEVFRLQQQLNSLFGTQSSSAPPMLQREHLFASGCGWMGGWCDDDDQKRCTSDADCDGTCVFSDKVCDGNRAIRCSVDAQCPGIGPCIEANEPALRSLRGNFSLDRDQISILSDFLHLRSRQEVSRVFREDLQTATEVSANDPDLRERRAVEDGDMGSFLFRLSVRFAVQTWSRIQARGESLMYPDGIDAQLETSAALGDLHTNISEIARLASKKDGLRAFVTDYAWFMRRSCIYRPCSLLLEQVIRLSTTDECFPYANGEYLQDDPDNPRWKKCKEGAGI